jgi:hypothetical protein
MSASSATLQGVPNALAGLQRTTKLTLILTLSVISGSTSAAPAVVHNCDGLDSIDNLVGHVRRFANGDIRIAHVTTEEPAAAPDHLLIFVAADAPIGPAECFAVSAEAYNSDHYRGFHSLSLAKIRASYDAQKGLLLRVSVNVANPESKLGFKPAGDIKVRVNRKSGNSVTIEK